MRRVLALLALVLAACPAVIREPPVTAPPTTAPRRSTTCYGGAPWVMGPDGWSQADRVCANLQGHPVCCRAASPYGGSRHACVPQAACLPEEPAAAPSSDAGAPADVAAD